VKGVCGAVTRKEAALVAEAGRRGGEEAEEVGVAGVLGSRGSGSSSRAAPASRRAVLLWAPPFSSSSSPSPSPPAAGRWVGDWIPPRRLGLGVPWVAVTASYSGGGAGGTWTAGMRREAAGRVATAAMTGAALTLAPASAKVLKGEDDDDDVGVTRGGPHLAVSDGRCAVGGQARADG
jgi:hypothetical protein